MGAEDGVWIQSMPSLPVDRSRLPEVREKGDEEEYVRGRMEYGSSLICLARKRDDGEGKPTGRWMQN